MGLDAPASTWMPSTRPARLLVIPCKFHRDRSSHSWDIVVTRSVRTNERTDERTNAADRQPEDIMPPPTMSDGGGIIRVRSTLDNLFETWFAACFLFVDVHLQYGFSGPAVRFSYLLLFREYS